MFGFSLGKLLLTAAIVAAVWYGFKWFSRLDVGRRDKVERKGSGGDAERAVEQSEELVKCAVCDTYVPAEGARDCGREGCPYPG